MHTRKSHSSGRARKPTWALGVVLMDKDPMNIGKVVKLSRKTLRESIVKETMTPKGQFLDPVLNEILGNKRQRRNGKR